jgi:hypothetical protein
MATTILDIPAGFVGTSETIIVPAIAAGHSFKIPAVRFTNLTNNPHQVTIFNRKPPQVAGDINSEIKVLAILGGSALEYGPAFLPPGRVLSCKADALNAINYRLHGWDITPSQALDIDPVLLQTTETIVVPTIPVGHEYDLSTIRFTNVTVNPHQIIIFNYSPASESPDLMRSEVRLLTIEAGSTLEYGPSALPPGRRISAQADTANAISARVHGVDIPQ